jgi:hypothetical protein
MDLYGRKIIHLSLSDGMISEETTLGAWLLKTEI